MSVTHDFFVNFVGMHQIPQLVRQWLEEKLSVRSEGFVPASGGCINHGGEWITDKGSFFIKWNEKTRYPEMFAAEAEGLKLLHSKKCIHIPEVLIVDAINDVQFIVMEFIRSGRKKNYYSKQLGEQLAALHKKTNEFFGLNYDNYIGSLPQHNAKKKTWFDFFITQRLEIQLTLAEKNNLVTSVLQKNFELLYKKLPELLPVETPALLHGDLWSGNLMVDENGEPCLIDPAVYYGHREAELAFSTLFGGFETEFYDAYNSAFPLQAGFETRIDLYNLYPLLVHANLFGGGYIHQVTRIVQKVL